MIKQYPHFLFVITQEHESVQDEHGDWSEETSSLHYVSTCREETNGRGSELRLGSGKYYKYSSLIQLPKGAESVSEGATVIVANDAEGLNIRIKGTVLKFDSGQLHCRMWID